jgi:uncharacterized protein
MLDKAKTKLIRFNPDETSDPNSATTTTEFYRDPTGAFKAGFWSSETSRSPVHYQKDEICILLAGVVRLTDENGHSETYRAGETFLIPNGFKGIWETVEPTRKFFAIHAPAKES